VFVASTDILMDMVSKLDNPDVALVYQMPYTTDHAGFAHAVEKVCLTADDHRFDHIKSPLCGGFSAVRIVCTPFLARGRRSCTKSECRFFC